MTIRSSLVSVAVALTALLRCSAAAPPSIPSESERMERSALFRVVDLSPQPGEALTENTVIEATIEYRVADFDSTAMYEIAPQFADKRGSGYTFNVPAGAPAVVKVTGSEGRVELQYPIRREWNDTRLARPVEMWIYLIEKKERSGRVVAKAGPFRY